MGIDGQIKAFRKSVCKRSKHHMLVGQNGVNTTKTRSKRELKHLYKVASVLLKV